MRRTLALAALVSIALPAAWAQKAKDFKLEEHTSDAGKFRVKFPPGKPKVETKELASGPGGVQTIPFRTERAEGPNSTQFAVTYADYPESFLGVKAKTVLDGARDAMKGKDGIVMIDREDNLDGTIPGREIRIEAGKTSSKKVIRARVFLAGTRLYQVMVTGEGQKADGKAADEFLKSFDIVK